MHIKTQRDEEIAAEDSSTSQTAASQGSMRTRRFLAMVHGPTPSGGAPVQGMLTLKQVPASCQPWPGAYWRSKTLAVPWTMYPRLGCTEVFFQLQGHRAAGPPPRSTQKASRPHSQAPLHILCLSACLSPFFSPCPSPHPSFMLLRPHCPMPFIDHGAKPITWSLHPGTAPSSDLAPEKMHRHLLGLWL